MKKNFKYEGWAYIGNHPDGKDTIRVDELDKLAEIIGVSREKLNAELFSEGEMPRGATMRINGHIIKHSRATAGKSDGFGYNFKDTYTLES